MIHKADTFTDRVSVFFAELQKNHFPNAMTLSEQCRCSRNTSQRTIYRLRDEYYVPIDYDPAKKGYFLLNRDYILPQLLPAGKDELTALLLARDIVQLIDAKDVQDSLAKLWRQIAANSRAITVDLEPLSKFFSSNLTAVGKLADDGILQYVIAAARGDNVRITYSSPWRGTDQKVYLGRVLHVHFSDGSLYLKFWDAKGRDIIFNASFIDSFDVLEEHIELSPVQDDPALSAGNWLDGFGVWSGESLEEIEIQIRPPAAKYYAAQQWHENQSDSWEGDILVRKFPGIISPELVRRVLSLGQYLSAAKPASLANRVHAAAECLVGTLIAAASSTNGK